MVEASDGVGGRVRTDVVDGYRLDRGFQVLLTAYPELERQLDVGALDLCRFEPGALVWDGSATHLVGDPLRRPSTLPQTVVAPIGSLADKLRILRQRVRLRRSDAADLLRQDDVSTLAALRADGFSERIIERFFRPLVGGIQLDPSLATSRRMFDVILRSLIVGDVAVPAGGMGEIPAQLAARLPPDRIHLDTPAIAVSPGSVRVEGTREISAATVILAVDGPSASELVGLPPVESNPATCVWFAADRPPVSGGHIVLDGTGAGPALNVAVMTNVAPRLRPRPVGARRRSLPRGSRPRRRAGGPVAAAGDVRLPGRRVASSPNRCDRSRATPPASAVRPEAARRPRRRAVRVRRPSGYGLDPGGALLRSPVRRGGAVGNDVMTVGVRSA